MLRRHFLAVLSQISIFALFYKANAHEENAATTTDLVPTVDPAVFELPNNLGISSAPLLSGPLCGEMRR